MMSMPLGLWLLLEPNCEFLFFKFRFFFSVAVFNFLTDAMGSVLRRLGFL